MTRRCDGTEDFEPERLGQAFAVSGQHGQSEIEIKAGPDLDSPKVLNPGRSLNPRGLWRSLNAATGKKKNDGDKQD